MFSCIHKKILRRSNIQNVNWENIFIRFLILSISSFGMCSEMSKMKQHEPYLTICNLFNSNFRQIIWKDISYFRRIFRKKKQVEERKISKVEGEGNFFSRLVFSQVSWNYMIYMINSTEFTSSFKHNSDWDFKATVWRGIFCLGKYYDAKTPLLIIFWKISRFLTNQKHFNIR